MGHKKFVDKIRKSVKKISMGQTKKEREMAYGFATLPPRKKLSKKLI